MRGGCGGLGLVTPVRSRGSSSGIECTGSRASVSADARTRLKSSGRTCTYTASSGVPVTNRTSRREPRAACTHTFKLRLGALEAVSASSNVHPNQSGTPTEACCRAYMRIYTEGVVETLRARAARLARKRFFSRVLARFLARRR